MSKRGSSVKRFCARRFHEGRAAFYAKRGPGRGKAAGMGYINARNEFEADIEYIATGRRPARAGK